eukprot:scaffold14758_cov130-Isochrysis_galbana.AAC.2
MPRNLGPGGKGGGRAVRVSRVERRRATGWAAGWVRPHTARRRGTCTGAQRPHRRCSSAGRAQTRGPLGCSAPGCSRRDASAPAPPRWRACARPCDL